MVLLAKRSGKRNAEYLVRVRFGHADEEIIYVDSGKSVVTGIRYDLIATGLALYVYQPKSREARRFQYTELCDVRAGDVTKFPRYYGNIEFTDGRTATPFGFDDTSLTKGALGRFVKVASDRATST